jgi:hypothetical protein
MYTQTTLDGLSVQIGSLLDDANEAYWVREEKYFAIYEALKVWGGYTQAWKSRGSVPLTSANPYYDLATYLPTVRSRSWTLGRMVREIQYALLEAPTGIPGTNMSGQITVTAILNSIQRARNRFVLDSMLPLGVDYVSAAPPPADGMVALDQDTMYVHRASWQDTTSGIYRNLWRLDAWAMDHHAPSWTTDPAQPYAFSESETAPLQLQIFPVPINEGVLELIDIRSLFMDLTKEAQTFSVPDEWIHGVKYGALANLLNVESQLFDPLRYQYADMRYKQAVSGARNIKTIIRILVNGQTVPIDALASLDAATPNWRNQTGRPCMTGVVHDFMVMSPVPDGSYGCTVDVVASAPLPGPTEVIQIGLEDLDTIVNYVTHVLTFKCGGNEFKSTFANYDAFMRAVSHYGDMNNAQVQYLEPMFGQPSKEQGIRPEAVKATKGNG